MLPAVRLLVLALVLVTTYVPRSARADVYFAAAGDDAIVRALNDGSGLETLADFAMTSCEYPAIDAAAQKIYFTDRPEHRIYRANLDGTAPELLLTTPTPIAIALDPAAGKMYWTSREAGTISVANMDGSNPETLHSGLSEVIGIAIDPVTARIFWTDSIDEAILYSDLDGANVDTLASGLDNPIGIATYPANGWVFWTESGADRISRIDVDGQNLVILAGPSTDSFFNLRGIAVDSNTDRLFVTTDSILGRMYRMTVHGGDKELIISDPFAPRGIAAYPPTGEFYWWHNGDRAFYRTNPLIVDDMTLAIAGIESPSGVALDEGEGALFWADRAHLFRVGVSGADFRRVTSAFDGDATAVACAPQSAKLYWTTSTSVYRANYDGTMVEDLTPACAHSAPVGIGVDETDGKLLWIQTNGLLHRANLDGSSCEDIMVPGLSQASAMALDAGADVVYIADSGTFAIRRYDLTTTAFDPIVPSAANVFGITIESAGQKLYWSEGFIRIRRADLDGSNAEDVIPVVNGPWGIVATDSPTPVQSTSWGRLKGSF